MKRRKPLLIVCFLCFSCLPKGEAQGIPTQQDRYTKAFDAVWKTVDQQFYDPSFLGVNWKAVGEQYRGRAQKVHND